MKIIKMFFKDLNGPTLFLGVRNSLSSTVKFKIKLKVETMEINYEKNYLLDNDKYMLLFYFVSFRTIKKICILNIERCLLKKSILYMHIMHIFT